MGTQGKPKSLADASVLRDLVHFIWVCDEVEYHHERSRIQLVFCMLLMAYTGSRPGSIVEPEYRSGSNDGLLYGDVALELHRHDQGVWFNLLVTIRNRKGRSRENPYVILIPTTTNYFS